jgi:hypothetical protein
MLKVLRPSRARGYHAVTPNIFLLSLVAVTALGLVGCGGPSSEEKYAEGVCSTTLVRARQMLDLHDDVVHTRAAPGPDARAQMLRLVLRGEDVTSKLRAELRALTPPDTEDGREAANLLDNFARLATERMATEERRVRALPESITLRQSIASLQRFELEVISAFADTTAVVRQITTEAPKLAGSFEGADQCKRLARLQAD